MSDVNPYTAVARIEAPPLTPMRRAIENALVQWMVKTGKPAQDLSVSQLCKLAFVARSTFYANYQHMGQVLTSMEDRLLYQLFVCAKPMRIREDGTDETMKSFNSFVDVLREHETEFRLLVLEQPSERFIGQWKKVLEYHVWHRLFAGKPDDEKPADMVSDERGPATVNRALVLDMAATAFISGVRFWLKTPQEVSVPEIRAIVVKLVNNIDEVW